MLQPFPSKFKIIYAIAAFGIFGLAERAVFTPLISAQEFTSDFQKFQSDDDGVAYEINFDLLANQKELLPLLDVIESSGGLKNALGSSIRNLKSFGGAVSDGNENPSTRIFLQSSSVIDGLAILRLNRLIPRNEVPETAELSGKTYFKFKYRDKEVGVFQPDDQTLIVNSLDKIEELVRGRRPKQKILRSKEWKDLDGYLVRIGFGEKIVDKWQEEYKSLKDRDLPSDPIMELVSPINAKMEKAFGGIKVDQALSIRVSLFGKDTEAARDIESSLQALLQIGKSLLVPAQEDAIESIKNENEKMIMSESFKIFNNLVKSIEFKRIGKVVHITARADYRSFVKNVLPDALISMQIAAKRTQSANNLKQLSLGMHNYHDVNKGFPPAVIIGPNGDRHSWRIAILPYIEQGQLYDQYRFDEPWDSANNTKVMKQMPAVFRHPNDPAGATNTRYLALTGPGTVFAKENEQATFRDITDGSSNTIMFLSGESNVPWTKPQDIEYDPEKNISMESLPFKDGFQASLFDGSVQFYPKDLDPKTLHLLIQANDGNPIPRNQ